MKIYILSICDNHHTRSSQTTLAVCTSMNKAIKLANQYSIAEYGNPLSEQDKRQLNSYMQTQGYEQDGEFIIEEYKTNQI